MCVITIIFHHFRLTNYVMYSYPPPPNIYIPRLRVIFQSFSRDFSSLKSFFYAQHHHFETLILMTNDLLTNPKLPPSPPLNECCIILNDKSLFLPNSGGFSLTAWALSFTFKLFRPFSFQSFWAFSLFSNFSTCFKLFFLLHHHRLINLLKKLSSDPLVTFKKGLSTHKFVNLWLKLLRMITPRGGEKRNENEFSRDPSAGESETCENPFNQVTNFAFFISHVPPPFMKKKGEWGRKESERESEELQQTRRKK